MKVRKAEVERRVARFEETARRAGVKLTTQRRAILRAVASSAEHPSAEIVFAAVRPVLPGVSLDTVYRTLRTLVDLGAVKQLGLRHESVRFDGNTEKHHHFTCVRCGAVLDFTSEKLDALDIPDRARAMGEVLEAHIEIRGVCLRCSKRGDRGISEEQLEPRGEKRSTP